MNKIINVKEAVELSSKFKKQNKSVVLAGGCFDILHIGHIRFLKKAKEKGDVLLVLLESDKSCSKKGKGRPVNSQDDRAEVLSSLFFIDYVIKLKEFMIDKDYDAIIEKLKPDIIATTIGDPNIIHKKRQARKVKAKLISVIKRLPNYSSTRILK